ncbi:ATP-binding protein [Roseibium sp. RKSG952]|uniref:ATP-binding protein n=1 Tax=Roseibium sp. RKSG952 TaxID=2529384 RepID=UPI001AD8D6C1|nr:ATP-binding protein [Roseibium sp. RKSG952]
MPYALGLAFLAGGVFLWSLNPVGFKIFGRASSASDDDLITLKRRCEDLEDRTWELRESDERNAGILASLGDIILRRDASGTLVYANAAAHETLGTKNRIAIGEAFALPLADMSPASHGNEEARSSGEHKNISFGDIRLETARGPRWFSRLDVSVRDAVTDQPLVQTVLRDVTDRRAIEEQLLAARQTAESSSAAKSRFLATVSHEIRTPLNGILGMTTLLRDTRLTKEQAAYIEALETSGETLLLLIDEVLDFSKVEAGKLEIQSKPTHLVALIESVAELLAPKAHAKGLEIGTYVAPIVPELVTVDAMRLRQILFNLAGNGIKFTDEGGVAIEISGETGTSGSTSLVITVRDTGIGFDAEQADRLFVEFEQFDHGTARKYSGTGLGLAIAQRLVRLMGGTITAETSVRQEGAVFRVTLPIPEELTRAETGTSISGKRFLLVGGSRIENPLLAEQLRDTGAEVNLMEPDTAVPKDISDRFDAMLIDSGTISQNTCWLEQVRASNERSPAIVLVTPSDRDQLDRMRKTGFAAYLIKPVRSETLMRVMNRVLDTRSRTSGWDDEALEADHFPEAPRIPAISSTPLKLLVAEDNDVNRILSEALLLKLGHDPTMVIDGSSAVSAAAQTRFDAILMDLHMPGVDGVEAIRQIRQIETRLGRDPVPILIVTADVMQEARMQAEAAGAAGYITKPLTANALHQALVSIQKAAG